MIIALVVQQGFTNAQPIVGYIGGGRLSEIGDGNLSGETIEQYNELIYYALTMDANGDIPPVKPVSNGVLTNTTYLQSYQGRSNGVLSLNGAGAKVNCGPDNLMGMGAFTWQSWVYIDSWVDGADIFRQGNTANNQTRLYLDHENSKKLIFSIENGDVTYAAADSALSVGQWHHVAVTFNGSQGYFQQVKLYVDGIAKELWYSRVNGEMPVTTSSVSEDLVFGRELNGKMDEIMLVNRAVSQGEIVSVMNNPINPDLDLSEKAYSERGYWVIQGHWPINDGSDPARDNIGFNRGVDFIKARMKPGAKLSVMLGGGGSWKNVIASSTMRADYISQVNQYLIDNPAFDGVSIDFEWAETVATANNMNTFIRELRTEIGNTKILSYSLHSFVIRSFPLPVDVIEKLDYVTVQSYDNGGAPYSKFVSDLQDFRNNKIPDSKIMMGIPFYGEPDDWNVGTTIGWLQFHHLVPDETSEIIPFTHGSATWDILFNNIPTIRQKGNKLREESVGAMVFAADYDLRYTHERSLLKALYTSMNDSLLAVDDLRALNDRLNIYPNPVAKNGNLRVDFNSTGANDRLNMKLVNVSGQEVLSQDINLSAGANHLQLETGNLQEGVYILKLNSSEIKIDRKIVIEK